MATDLERSFIELCDAHNVKHISLTAYAPSDSIPEPWFSVTVQWTPHGCVIENGATIADALGKAIHNMKATRGLAEPVALADEPLPEPAA